MQCISAMAKKDFLSQMYEELTVFCIGVAVFLVDLVVTIMFVIGGHKVKLQNTCYLQIIKAEGTTNNTLLFLLLSIHVESSIISSSLN